MNKIYYEMKGLLLMLVCAVICLYFIKYQCPAFFCSVPVDALARPLFFFIPLY